MKRATKYFRKLSDELVNHLDIPYNSYTEATLHDVRIVLKKLDALLDVLNYCNKDFKRRKTSKLFKLIFKTAGLVRELDVERSILKIHFEKGLISFFERLQQQKIELANEAFSKLLGKRSTKPVLNKLGAINPFVKK